MNLISLLFGEPYRESKLFLFFYWFVVAFYFVGLIMTIFLLVVTGEWFFIIPLLLFPLLFRLVYKINTFIYQSIFNAKSHTPITKKKWVVIGSAFAVFMMMVPILLFLFSNNVVTNVSQTNVNGQVELSIGSLRGLYEVESFNLEGATNDLVTLPYVASVKEGSFVLFVERNDGETVWSEEVFADHSGEMVIEQKEGTYRIKIEAEEAKGINVALSLN
ncbi:hypothetical protein AB3N04_09745 [Alkalihalophilus sp. As8PL]|uniref:Uncharacterized protein n=1 Tax=Alkalihalophilus sp. As8PL TaxID=3237103 RepID=A0AB39BYF5_9BACI